MILKGGNFLSLFNVNTNKINKLSIYIVYIYNINKHSVSVYRVLWSKRKTRSSLILTWDDRSVSDSSDYCHYNTVSFLRNYPLDSGKCV